MGACPFFLFSGGGSVKQTLELVGAASLGRELLFFTPNRRYYSLLQGSLLRKSLPDRRSSSVAAVASGMTKDSRGRSLLLSFDVDLLAALFLG